jgi:hypothetical protein
MYCKSQPKAFVGLILTLITVLIVTGSLSAAETIYYLRAEEFSQIMPDDANVPMWGFTEDTDENFLTLEGFPTSPGPMLMVPNQGDTLTIHVKNNLTVPVSLVIPGLATPMVPVFFTDGNGRQRVRSFTHETAPGTDETYTWANIAAGNYMYHSGTHPQVQVQMGLYGGVKVYFDTETTPYDGIDVDGEVDLFFSEVDPLLHDAVADGSYGTPPAMTSTMGYDPKYFLINGAPHDVNSIPIPTGAAGDSFLLRFYNAGLESHVAVVEGMDMSILSEEGFLYPFPRNQFSALLAAQQTRDALVTLPADGLYAVYDRTLHLTNGPTMPGGMMSQLLVGPAVVDPQPVIVSVTATPDTVLGSGACQSQLSVVATDADALTYSWSAKNCLGSFDDPTSATPIFTTPESTGSQVIPITVYVTDASNTVTSTVDLTIVTAATPIVDLIIDDGDPGTTSIGSWLPSGGANPWGGSSLYSKTTGGSYTFTGNRTGEDNVYLRWTPWSSRPASVSVQVFDGDSLAIDTTVNQQANANTWFLLGTHTFTGIAKVVVNTVGGTTSTNVDAVKFESTVVIPGVFVDHVVIIGPDEVYKNSTRNYDLMAVYSDGDTAMVDPDWFVNDPNFTIDSTGALTVGDVTEDTPIVITAEYNSIGCTYSDTLNATVLNADGPPPVDVIVDNRANNNTSTGDWLPSGATNYYGVDSQYTRVANDTFTFKAELANTDYNLYMRWTAWASRETNIPVTISVGGSQVGSTFVNQQETPSQWVWLGNYPLGADTQVTLTSPGGGSTNADAVWFEPGPVPPLTHIIDNGDAGTSSTGSWAVSGGSSPYGANSLWSRGVGDTYTFEKVVTGTYSVEAWWTAFSSRHDDVPFQIYDGASLVTTVNKSQMTGGGQWNELLASHIFTTSIKVVIESTTVDFSTCADAIRLIEQ